MEPPRKPSQVSPSDFDEFEIITQENIEKVLKQIEDGERAPLNHVAIEYSYYLTMAAWMKAVDNFIMSSEEYFAIVDADYKKIIEKQEKENE